MRGLHIIRNPAGTYHFVGCVPATLAYEACEADLAIAASAGPGIARRIAEREGRTFRTLTWATEEAARAYAWALGYTVSVEG